MPPILAPDSHFRTRTGGYPATAQCSALVENCLYCWKQVETVTMADGWSSKYQFKSCVPWAVWAPAVSVHAAAPAVESLPCALVLT